MFESYSEEINDDYQEDEKLLLKKSANENRGSGNTTMQSKKTNDTTFD